MARSVNSDRETISPEESEGKILTSRGRDKPNREHETDPCPRMHISCSRIAPMLHRMRPLADHGGYRHYAYADPGNDS